jgi:hypothetical protein
MKQLFVATAAVVFALASTPADAQIAVHAFTAGWTSFGQAVPQGAATSGLQLGSLFTQTDVKTRWPDGSIRFAVVSASVPAAGTYAISPAPIAGGAFTPALPSASVALTIGSATYTAALPAVSSNDMWLSGGLVYEGRTVIAPVSSTDGTAHPFLRVIFDTRVYNDGAGRVDVTVENVLDKTGATTVTYNVAIALNGQTAFARNSVQHYYLTRWRKLFTFGAAAFAAITPDMKPFYASRALPPYLPLVANLVTAPTGANFDILQRGALTANMPDHGGRQELAPYPDWTARYLVHRDPTQRAFVLANGDLSGSWPVHVREAESAINSGVGSERLVSLDQRPSIWYDSRAKNNGLDFVHGSPMPIIEYGSTVPGAGQSPLIPDNAHQPSIAYVPYLLTGDRYYAEEMAFWANYAMLRTYPADGVRGSQGILAYNEVRGYGWGLRNIVDAAAYYPGAAVRSYLVQKVTSNLTWLDNFANAQSPTANPFRILWIGKRPDGNQFISMWEQNYLTYAIDRALKQGFAGGLAHRDAIARFQLALFTSDPSYPRAQGAPYIVGVGVPPAGTVRYTDYNRFTFYTSMSQIWSATQGNERPFAGYYGPEARINLMIGVESGWTGARAAYDYLWPFIGSTNTFCGTFGPDKPDLACRAGWALDFSSATPPPPPPPAPTVGSFAASPGAITQGQSSTLSWSVSNAATVTIDPGIGGVSASGTRVVSPAATTTYTLSAANAAGTATATTAVTVNAAADTTPPTVVSTTPAAGASAVATTTSVTAVFSEAMNAATITATTFALRNGGGAAVAAAVSYNAAGKIATLTPSQPLSALTTYTATVVGGSGGVADLAGNNLPSSVVWSFTTAAVSTPGPVTIWSTTARPAAIATNDPSAVELGLKFKSDVAGTVAAVRFYKGQSTTGTHIGTLWSSTGTKLATATFTNETATGWQQVNFATPVAISANTVYVISYHTNVGNYPFTAAYFGSAGVDSAPLHALSNSAAGGNGVYRYSTTVVFPSSTFNSNNYWVDVVFVPQ